MHAPPATADPVTLALFNYDSNFAAEGWVPMSFGTIPIWIASFTLDDLKASKHYSPTDRETIKCSQTNTVFQGSVANTLYEKGAMPLRLYYEALKDQNTLQAIRAQFGKTSVSIIKLLLLLVRAHKDLGSNKVNTVPCDFKPEAVAKLLEEWSAHRGNETALLARELPRKRQPKSGSAEAGEADLQTACQGGIDCKKQGGKHITIQEWNRHNTLCTEQARQFRIPQEFSPRMLTWIQDCLDAGHDVNTVIDSLY
eukprot:g68730.t1